MMCFNVFGKKCCQKIWLQDIGLRRPKSEKKILGKKSKFQKFFLLGNGSGWSKKWSQTKNFFSKFLIFFRFFPKSAQKCSKTAIWAQFWPNLDIFSTRMEIKSLVLDCYSLCMFSTQHAGSI